MTQIRASIYGLIEPGHRVQVKELWSEIARDTSREFDGFYLYQETLGYRIVIREFPSLSPDNSLARYRTIEAGIRRRQGKPTLLDLSVGNIFCEANAEPTERLHVDNDHRHSIWARRASQIPLTEHVRLIERFVEHVMDAGWMLERADLSRFQIPPPAVRNGRAECLLPTKGFGQLARYPALGVPSATEFVVVDTRPVVADRAAAALEAALSRCFPGSLKPGMTVGWSRDIVRTAVNLILLDDRDNLGENQKLRDKLRRAEADGCRFKLAKTGSLSKLYPTKNIAYDIFQIAGGKPWVPAVQQPEFCSLDAGHSAELNRSRWTKVETDADQCIVAVKVVQTALAEHIPHDCIAELWPTQHQAMVCRDGRLSQERGPMETRAAAENRPLLEVKKSPKAILWRVDCDRLMPAQFGDTVLDEHGDVLLQTVPQNVGDYIHPIRLTACRGQVAELATAFLHQHAIPGLSLFHMSRLPGSLYFADLISKLTSDGWTKAIGRQLGLSSHVP